MKHLIKTTLFIVSTVCLSQNTYAEAPTNKTSKRYHSHQIQLGGFTAPHSNGNIAPLIEYGERFELDNAALDISVSYGELQTKNKDRLQYWTLPKVNYFLYATPKQSSSVYYGGGLSYGGVKACQNKFSGLIGNAVIGYEFQREKQFKPFVQMSLNQPLLTSSHNSTSFHPNLAATLGILF